MSVQIYVVAAIDCFILDRLGKDLAKATQLLPGVGSGHSGLLL